MENIKIVVAHICRNCFYKEYRIWRLQGEKNEEYVLL